MKCRLINGDKYRQVNKLNKFNSSYTLKVFSLFVNKPKFKVSVQKSRLLYQNKSEFHTEMISYFKNSTKFVLATGSEISLFQLQEKENVEEFIYEDIKPQCLSKC